MIDAMATGPTAEELLTRADELVRVGRPADASALIVQAAEIYAADGRTADQARCLALAAGAARMGGALSAAQANAMASIRTVATGSMAAVQAAAELAATLVAAGRPGEAVARYSEALDRLQTTDRPEPAAEAVLFRKRALARILADEVEQAIADLEAAAEGFAAADLARAERAVLVEAATLATQRSTASRGRRLRDHARIAAARADDAEAAVDLDLLDAAVAVNRGDTDGALRLTLQARQRSLDAVSTIKYVSASFALSELHDLRGEREGAYEALSTAWATLSDLMGSDAARSIVEPRLEALVERWGPDEFWTVRKRYEARRRAELGLV